MRKSRTPIMLVLASLLASFIAFVPLGTVANASSAFDDTYKTASKLLVGDANCDFQTNITDTWSSYITDEALWGTENVSITEDAKEAFLEAQQDGDVSVSQVTWQQTSTQVGKYVTVYFSEDKTSSLAWSGWNQAVTVNGYQYGLLIGCNSGIDASHPTIWLFSTPANSSIGALSQSGSTTITNFFTTAAQNLPSGYDGVPIVTQAPATESYVAMGDSFSSGEGVEPFDPATATSTDTCHRSTLAYANLLSADVKIAPYLATEGFAACSGAETGDITTNSRGGESPQYEHLGSATGFVTLTIGGNDIKFTEFARACALDTCQEGSSAYNTSLIEINNNLSTNLEAAYKKILLSAPNAQIYVLDYPQVVAAKSPSDAFDIRCGYMYNSGSNETGSAYYPWEDDWAARDIVTKLDDKISDVIVDVRSQDTDYLRLHHVPVNSTSSPFTGHSACDSGASYFNNIDTALGHESYAFHPNAYGQAAYAAIVKDEINAG